MKIIDRIVEAIGLVEEEEYDEEEELAQEEAQGAKEERKSIFRPKAELIAKERAAREEAAAKKAQEEKQAREAAAAKEAAAKEEAARREAERQARQQRLAAKREAAAREAAAKEERAKGEDKPARKPFFSFASKGPRTEMTNRTIEMPIDNKPVQVVVLEPVSFDDSQKVADFLRGSRPVIINFEGTDNLVAKRMTDFVSGTIYALNGSMKKIGRNILVCAPRNVKIDADMPVPEEGQSDNIWKK